ncbi:CD48 antigen-like [Carassius gibelio]|uniref:CD48 antigen-like n=1 Tax=Carassius gibelio TaxID=101364 RepID=UPI002279BC39|nr:CD48 antigen-like [Carassius gibelio]
MEEESVTLQTFVTKIHDDDDILWIFGAEMSLIAKISIENQIFSTFDDVHDGRFRDRLKLDNQTGSLTITNITTQHAGVYKLEINGVKRSSKTFNVSVYGPLPTSDITRDCSSSSSSSHCSLVCSVVNVGHVTLSWYKGNSLLSSISVSDLSISLSLPLEVEYQEKNSYSCVINNPITNQTTHLNITELCQPCPDQGLPLFYTVLIPSAAGCLLIFSVVICCICRKCRKTALTQEEDRTDSALCKPATRKTVRTLCFAKRRVAAKLIEVCSIRRSVSRRGWTIGRPLPAEDITSKE